MKSLILFALVLGSFSAYAGSKEVEIVITADSNELCKIASQNASLSEVEDALRDKELRVVEITNCNRTLTGKHKKIIRFAKITE